MYNNTIEEINYIFNEFGLQTETIELLFIQDLLKNVKPEMREDVCFEVARKICTDTIVHKISQFNEAREKEKQ